MKKNVILLAFMAFAALALVSGCVKDQEIAGDYSHDPGMDIVFGASTSWTNDIETRTEYSGKDQDNRAVGKTTTKERINWIVGKDRIRILCEQATGKSDPSKKTADYVIFKTTDPTDETHQAQITS